MFPLVYEINTRIWLRNLSLRENREIGLGEIPEEEFAFFRESGFDIVWLMGVWQPSLYSRAVATTHPCLRTVFLQQLSSLSPEDIGSSPYSIPAYTVSQELGGREGLLAFRERLRRDGIKLMLDFVPNHLALDNIWLPDHPEYFIPVCSDEQCQDPDASFEYAQGNYLAHGKDPYFPPWTDTLQLNYANPATHEMMTGNLLAISELCDAVRCDVAMLVLKSVFNTTWEELGGHMEEEFWQKAIARVRRDHPGFLFLAESYWNKEWELQQQGFDFTYDKPFYDCITSPPVNVAKLRGHLGAEWAYHKRLCRFLENHDEPRAAGKLKLNNRVGALVFMSVPGMHLVHQGQMEGLRKNLPVQLLRQAPEEEDRELSALYAALFALQRNPAFREGGFEWLELQGSTFSHCFGFRRHAGRNHAIVVANFNATGISVEFTHASLEGLDTEKLELFGTGCTGRSCAVSLEEGVMQVRLSPHEGVAILYNT